MKIVNLKSENVKRLTAVSITPDGNLVQITGANGQGKSSVLDSLWWALSDKSKIDPMPVRLGQKKGITRLDLGELVVTRTYRANDDGSDYTTSLSVENAEGTRFPSPQAAIERLLGPFSIDALKFANATDREQFEVLRSFVPGVDFDAIAKANAADYAERTDLNRRAKQLRSMESGALEGNVPDAPADLAAIDEEMRMLSETNAATIMLREKAHEQDAALDAATIAVRNSETRVLQLRAALSQHETDLAAKKDVVSCIAKDIASRPDIPPVADISPLLAKAQLAREHNARYQRRMDARGFAAQALELEKKSDALTVAMARRAEETAAAIAASKMPVDGLSLGDGRVMFGSVPFSQASDAKRLEVSARLAFAAVGDLRVVRIRDGSLLDEKSLEALAKMADEADCQVWIERVDTSGKVGFVIEDGHVKGATDA